MDFMNLAEVPEVESVKDGDTVFVVRDGEVCRVAKDKVGGGGAGGYVVNAAFSDVSADNGLIIATPIPGMMDAARNGASVSVNMDIGLVMSEDEVQETGVICTMQTLGVVDACEFFKIMFADEEDFDESMLEQYEGMVISGMNIMGTHIMVMFTNGQVIPTNASLSTLSLHDETTPSVSLLDKLRSKLGGGASDEL